MDWTVRGSNLSGGEIAHVQSGRGDHPASYAMRAMPLSQGWSGRGCGSTSTHPLGLRSLVKGELYHVLDVWFLDEQVVLLVSTWWVLKSYAVTVTGKWAVQKFHVGICELKKLNIGEVTE